MNDYRKRRRRPGSAQGRPGSVEGRPAGAQGQSADAQGRPGSVTGRPGDAQGQSADAQGRPGSVRGRPGDARGRRGYAQGRSPGAQGKPASAASGGPARRPRPADPRRTAYDVLAAVRDREAYANLLLPRLLAERGLAGRDAALATELAYGTLRGQGSYDAVLAACSDRPLGKLDPPVLDVLRLGTHQLLSTRIGAHAAVATSVDLAKSVAGPRVAGYVNAVLRRVATRDLPAWLDIVAPDSATDQDGYLATRYSHPRWIVAAYRDALGPAATQPAPPPAHVDALGQATTGEDAELTGQEAKATPGAAVTELAAALAAGNARPRVTLATFPPGPPREDVMPAGAVPGRWSPYAFTLSSGDPAALVESGAAAVQDEGSQLAALALSRAPVAAVTPAAGIPAAVTPAAGIPAAGIPAAVTPAAGIPAAGIPAAVTPAAGIPAAGAPAAGAPAAGIPAAGAPEAGAPEAGAPEAGAPAAGLLPGVPERWLDLCAGPGGKSRLLYGLAADRGATLVAAELHPHRAALVRDALAAAGPAGDARYEVVVADGTRPAWPDGAFDRVLVDAPCSGLGALRRRPEARWRKSEADLKELTAIQRDLLRAALAAVRPGGVVAYVTCSPVPAETAEVVTDVTAATPGTEILDAPAALPGVPGTRAPDPRFAQLWPHRHGTDAIFVALLRRTR
jgi:16S rRNA (cytosine967-C5)-methyltransferase